MLSANRYPSILLLALLLPGCASAKLPLHQRYDQIWERGVREQGLDPDLLSNPVATTDMMRRTAREVVQAADPREQLRQLQQYLFDEKLFPFNYQARGTFTAREAFERREGNCVTFTSLFIALGRSLGIPLVPALILRGDSEREGNLVVINTHMVALYYHGDGVTMYDFAQTRTQPVEGLSLIDDVWLTAIFENNRGVEELRGGDYQRAVARLENATRLAPKFTASYANLGVAYRLAGQADSALNVYRRALSIEGRDPTILNNLASLYQSMGLDEEARGALRAADLSNATPYLLITRGDLELAQGNIGKALKLYKRARRLAPEIADPYVAIARLEVQRDRLQAARRALGRALELNPDSSEAQRLSKKVGFRSSDRL